MQNNGGLPGPQEFERFLAERGIKQPEITKLGLVYITAEGVSDLLGRAVGSDAVGIPYYDRNSKPVYDERIGKEFCRVRLLRQSGQGKYQQPRNSLPHVYLSPLGWDWAQVQDDPRNEIVITEGEFKSMRACMEESFPPTVGLGGVDSWGGKAGQTPLAAELMPFIWRERTVYVCFDADEGAKGYKPEVWLAILRLGERLRLMGATVKCVDIHRTPVCKAAAKKMGLDDYIAAGGTWADLAATAYTLSDQGLTDLNKMLSEFGLIKFDDSLRVIELATGMTMKPNDFRLLVGHRYMPSSEKPIPTWKAWELSDKKIVLRGYDNDPSQIPGGITKESRMNLWRGFDARPVADEALAKLWCDLVERFFTDDPALVPLFHSWVAQIVQKPWQRNLTSWVIIAVEEGIGKSLIGEIIAKMFGIHGKRAPAVILGPDELFSEFNQHLEAAIFVVANEPSSDNERHTRAMRAARSNDMVNINVKYGMKFSVPNRASYWITGNDVFTHGMSRDSRRDIVYRPITVARDKKWRTWVREAASRLTTAEGLAAVMAFYMNLNIEGYDPTAPAPATSAKEAAAEAAEPAAVTVADEIIERFGDQAIIPVKCLKEVFEGQGIRVPKRVLSELRHRVTASTGVGRGAARAVGPDGTRMRVIAYSNDPDKVKACLFVTALPDAANEIRRAQQVTMDWLAE